MGNLVSKLCRGAFSHSLDAYYLHPVFYLG